jgi:hypothetical protein
LRQPGKVRRYQARDVAKLKACDHSGKSEEKVRPRLPSGLPLQQHGDGKNVSRDKGQYLERPPQNCAQENASCDQSSHFNPSRFLYLGILGLPEICHYFSLLTYVTYT